MKHLYECMKTNVVAIPQQATVRQAFELCIRYHVGTLPVVDEDSKLVGVLRLRDMLALGMPDFVNLIDKLDFIHDFGAVEHPQLESGVLSKLVNQLMRQAVFVEQTAGLLRASALLHKHQLSDIPVIDEDGKLVGIASHVDIGLALLSGWMSE